MNLITSTITTNIRTDRLERMKYRNEAKTAYYSLTATFTNSEWWETKGILVMELIKIKKIKYVNNLIRHKTN